MRHSLVAPLALLMGMTVAQSQTTYPTKLSPELVDRPEIRRALAYVDEHFARQVAEWIRITEIPAPSGHETARATYIKNEFEKLGLPVTVDPIAMSPQRAGAPAEGRPSCLPLTWTQSFRRAPTSPSKTRGRNDARSRRVRQQCLAG